MSLPGLGLGADLIQPCDLSRGGTCCLFSVQSVLPHGNNNAIKLCKPAPRGVSLLGRPRGADGPGPGAASILVSLSGTGLPHLFPSLFPFTFVDGISTAAAKSRVSLGCEARADSIQRSAGDLHPALCAVRRLLTAERGCPSQVQARDPAVPPLLRHLCPGAEAETLNHAGSRFLKAAFRSGLWHLFSVFFFPYVCESSRPVWMTPQHLRGCPLEQRSLSSLSSLSGTSTGAPGLQRCL